MERVGREGSVSVFAGADGKWYLLLGEFVEYNVHRLPWHTSLGFLTDITRSVSPGSPYLTDRT